MFMNLISCTDLSKAYFEKVLFEHISFGIDEGERIGIIGRNGVGKSSLLRIIAGLDEADAGNVAMMRGCRIEYLEQQPQFDVDATALDAVCNAYRTTHDIYEPWEVETRATIMLGKLGIHDATRNVHAMSGGQRKRVALARALISEPDLLILDEPTNHLDADSVQWLQDELQSTRRGLLLVTHDRYFLDAVSTRILELDQQRMYSFEGGYEKYLERKETMLSVQEATADHERNKLRRELAWLQKGAKARRTKQKSRIDWIASMQASDKPVEQRTIEIEIGHRFLGGKIIDAVNVSKRINGKPLFADVTYRAAPGDRIGIIGPNGAGKSTLLNVLAGRSQPDSGFVDIGETVKIGFFDQEIKSLDPNRTVTANLRDIAEYIDVGVGRERYITATELLDRFLFSRKQQNAYVHTLSGGEQRRLALLQLLMADPNVIFLDEPTNDFDIATLTALEDYLDHFKGVLLIVSHDRAFLDRTVQTIWSFESDGRVKEYPGNYSAYLEKIEAARTQQPAAPTQPKPSASASRDSTAPKKLSFNERRELEQLEKTIAELETKRDDIERRLSEATEDYQILANLGDEHGSVLEAIDVATMRWLELSERG
ncbi:MAG: ABC-F family ATP-binding cassette domain-containing protein [Candidatus Kapabacteria bacterium]|nr:ABC-F family ATP-binding cassette domain-containing protein [Candidatus Kapabacteria bacterium]